ncbi:uncharacterized protein PHALS_15497 [Plasmopara halstedii]|uniref:Uncharacterized protein n=1 Tax=Plasmopara halstedii TaxID=4781 RepID=A0A0P1A4S9_PLAHL|nr:uncharacterized protein PHALS_15497 [Plasmopara halstedii]CEG35542.1 hypothetical protein PHALS_15497 [Plasmopara halstedii]|eukprot:XP_024571911.1 hypothetical protein PHALS_15497 [Plasmopara halstedii]
MMVQIWLLSSSSVHQVTGKMYGSSVAYFFDSSRDSDILTVTNLSMRTILVVKQPTCCLTMAGFDA